MKKLLIVCGAGHATSTIAVAKSQCMVKKKKHTEIKNIHSTIIAELKNKYDF